MVTAKIKTKVIVCVTLLGFLFGSVGTVSGFSIGEEKDLGEKLLYSVRSSFNLIDDPDITIYLTKLGRSVLDVAGIQYFDYHFFVINDNQFNAFAAPSGLIFFYSGLVETMNSENELLSVMAHEIGHIVKRHLADRMKKGTYSSIASLGLALAAVAFGGNAAPVLLSGALATGQSLNLHFSRQNEEEADAMAFTWMERMHRDPNGQARMLESMRRIARYRSEKLPQYLLTHPNPEARLGYVEGLIDATPAIPSDTLVPEDNFAFQRFKYRVMSKAKESQEFKIYLANKRSRSEKESLDWGMAAYGLALIAAQENDYTKALTLIDEVIALYPEKSILLADRGSILLEAGRLDESEVILKELLKKDPSNVYGAYLLGMVHYRMGSLSKASNLFTRVSYELPEFSKVYYQMGRIASDEKNAPLSLFYLGKYYLMEGRIKLAQAKLNEAGRGGNGKLEGQYERERQRLLEKIKKIKK